MSRKAREFSESGYMHVIVRGNGKQILFEEEQDYQVFLSELEKYSTQLNVKICAYCLMDNHVHMLILDKDRNMPIMMQKLEISYSRFYNRKYDRTGHLFQNRYLSEAVDSERYLLSVFRYILLNPAKAGLCAGVDYKWNSYFALSDNSSFVDLGIIKDLIGDNISNDGFFSQGYTADCMEFEKIKHDDEWAKRILKDVCDVETGAALKSFDIEKRNEFIRKLRKEGLSIRQIERLTGIGRGVIQRI